MDTEHFILPHGNVQIAFSGGRTSGFMLHNIIEANGGIPEGRCQVTFQNTGREMPQTLDFVADVGQRWGVMVTWLEYRGKAPFFEIVGHQGASRNGEPFEELIRRRRFLPNQHSRFCTEELKIRTAKRYLMSIGWREWITARGIRADENHRVKTEKKERSIPWNPLADAGVTRQVVSDFWARQPFDLRLPNRDGRCWLGNCDGCFLKSEASIAAFAREFPERAKWWEQMESDVSAMGRATGRAAFWSKRYTRKQMREMMDRQGDILLSTEGALCQADDGECFG